MGIYERVWENIYIHPCVCVCMCICMCAVNYIRARIENRRPMVMMPSTRVAGAGLQHYALLISLPHLAGQVSIQVQIQIKIKIYKYKYKYKHKHRHK